MSRFAMQLCNVSNKRDLRIRIGHGRFIRIDKGGVISF